MSRLEARSIGKTVDPKSINGANNSALPSSWMMPRGPILSSWHTTFDPVTDEANHDEPIIIPTKAITDICKAINIRIREASMRVPFEGATPRSRDNPQRTRHRNKHAMNMPLAARLRIGLDGREFFLIPYALARLNVFDRELLQHCLQRLEPLALSRIPAARLDIMLAIEGFCFWATQCGPGQVLDRCNILEMRSAVLLPQGVEPYKLTPPATQSSYSQPTYRSNLLPQQQQRQGSSAAVECSLLPNRSLAVDTAIRALNQSSFVLRTVPSKSESLTGQSEVHRERYSKAAARIALLWQFLLEQRTIRDDLIILVHQADQWNLKSVLIWRVLADCLGRSTQPNGKNEEIVEPSLAERMLKLHTLARKRAGLSTRQQVHLAALESLHLPHSTLTPS